MKKIIIVVSIIILILLVGGIIFFISLNKFIQKNTALPQEQENQIEEMIQQRREEKESLGKEAQDVFDENGIVKILFIGLDNRVGQTAGHCDAIQLIEIDKNEQAIKITAVPRGTYSPLPGTGHLPTDYYVSKSCEVGGLEYGVEQIEKILGQKADYVVFLGFSQALGIFRQLELPANETMQWLRMRQGFAIGEPQRAKNHSTFIKQMLLRFSPELDSQVNLPLAYMLFKLIRTDLSIEQALAIANEVNQMDLENHPEKISLAMRPAYVVQDIPYNEENINENIARMINPIAEIIPENAYTGETLSDVQARLLQNINEGLNDKEFISWAFDNYLWLQIDDDQERESAHYQILERYISLLEDQVEKNEIIADYIIEKEDLGQDDWALQGKDLLEVINKETIQ